MSKVDWSLAPEGATHFLPAHTIENCDVWFKIVDGYVVSAGYTRLDGWAHNYTKDCQPSTNMTRLISRKDDETKQWSGPEDGLPPVGTTCEALNGLHDQWRTVLILDHEGSVPTAACRDGENRLWWSQEFRAIKTPEQLAAEKRESAIRELMDIAQVDCRVTAARLVDAGFKRGLKTQDKDSAINDLASEISGYFNSEDPETKHEKLARYLFDQGFKREVV